MEENEDGKCPGSAFGKRCFGEGGQRRRWEEKGGGGDRRKWEEGGAGGGGGDHRETAGELTEEPMPEEPTAVAKIPTKKRGGGVEGDRI